MKEQTERNKIQVQRRQRRRDRRVLLQLEVADLSVIGISSFTVLLVAGPQGEVVPQELHDECGVLIGVLVQIVQVADGIIKSFLGKLAGLLGRILDLVVEDRKVECQAQADGMGGRHALANIESLFVGAFGRFDGRGPLFAGGHLGQVPVVVALHLQVKDLALHLGFVTVFDEVLVQQRENVLAH